MDETIAEIKRRIAAKRAELAPGDAERVPKGERGGATRWRRPSASGARRRSSASTSRSRSSTRRCAEAAGRDDRSEHDG
jgi:hypothetical protein